MKLVSPAVRVNQTATIAKRAKEEYESQISQVTKKFYERQPERYSHKLYHVRFSFIIKWFRRTSTLRQKSSFRDNDNIQLHHVYVIDGARVVSPLVDGNVWKLTWKDKENSV